jgi:hypothetical protein
MTSSDGSATAQRIRRHRERRRRGLVCATVALSEPEIAYFRQKQLLACGQEKDRNALSRALRAFLNRAFLGARERERPGVFQIELDDEHIDRLIAMRFLNSSQRRDPDAVIRAFSELAHRAIFANRRA